LSAFHAREISGAETARENCQALVEAIDLFPTLAGFCELSTGDLKIEGRDLTPLAEGKADSKNAAFSESYAIKNDARRGFQIDPLRQLS